MSACHRCFQKRSIRVLVVALYTFLASSILIAFLLPAGGLQRIMKLISNYWLGTFLYILLTVVIADLIRLLLIRIPFRYSHRIFCRKGFIAGGTLSILLIAALSLDGIYGASHLQVTQYDVTVEKAITNGEDTLKVVLIADLHLGYSIGSPYMKKMVDRINEQSPDLVVIAGDIFDNDYDALDNPDRLVQILSGIESRYGVYACYGNHDIQEKLLAGFTLEKTKEKVSDPRMDALLEKAGIRLLQDEGILIDDSFYLYGRPDAKKPGRGIAERKSPAQLTEGMNLSKPILVIDHEPRQLEELSKAGVDLDLCGHTHDGQMFPGNLLTSLMWENSCGYLQKGSMHNIVTSGVGVFGPNMRVGTKSEICVVNVHFAVNCDEKLQ